MNGRNIGQSVYGWQRLVLLALVLVWATPSFATTEEFRILAAGVDDLSTKANDKAFDYARKRAVYLAIQKMGISDPGIAAAKLTDEQLKQIVRGASITKTTRKDNITYQEVLVTIVVEPLRHALGLPENDTGSVATRMRPVLVLPVLVTPERPYVWEKENTFRPVLADALLNQSHGTVMVASGDFGDLRLIDYQNALKVKPDELKPMFERYGAEEIIIAVLTPGAPRSATPSSVLLRRLTPTGEQNEVMEIPPEGATETAENRLSDASQKIATALTQIAAATALTDQQALAKANHFKVQFLYANPRELTNLQETIRTLPGVIQLEIPAISLKDVSGTIYFTGDREKLTNLLTKTGIRVRDADDILHVSVR